MRFILCLLSASLFISCANQTSPVLQDIVNKWTSIDLLLYNESAHLITASDDFIQSLLKFKKSDLYRIYRAIPLSPGTERSFFGYSVTDIPEIEIVTELAFTFRDSVITGDMENAKRTSVEMSEYLISLLLIDGKTQQYISSSYLDLLIALVFFIAIIILLILFLHRSLTTSLKREAERTIFSHAYMLAQDEERGRISRELHDTVIQDMRCLMLENEKTVPKMAELIRKTRDICASLIPPDFRFSELPDALRQLCVEFGEKTGIDCRAEIDGNISLEFTAMEKRLQVFRIVQEALSNIEKHAKAKEAIVTMRQTINSGRTGGIIYISIGDDGKGFIPPLDNSGRIIKAIDKSHIGIISMKERAAILGGRLRIESETGEGALICLEIPVSCNDV